MTIRRPPSSSGPRSGPSPPWPSGTRGRRRVAPLELRPGPGPARRQDPRGAPERRRLRRPRKGPDPRPGRAPAHRHPCPARGPTPSWSWPTTARACSSRTTRRPPPGGTGSATGSRKNPPGRPGSARTSTSATTPSTPTSGPSRASTTLAFDGNGSALDDLARGPLPAVPGAPAGRRPPLHRRQPDRPRRPRLVHGLPPIYPVIPPSRGPDQGRRGPEVSVSQTNFESAPVVVRADVAAVGFDGQPIVAVVTRRGGKEVARQEAKATADGKPLGFRFQFRPEKKGIGFYKVVAFAASAESEAERGTIDEGPIGRADPGQQHPARRGRPGGRAVPGALPQRPAQLGVQVPPPGLAGRRAGPARRPDPDRQAGPKFDFQAAGHADELAPLQRLRQPRPDTAEAADQPVLIRLDRGRGPSFATASPRRADELYRYHAIVIDDLEASFFTQDQLALIRNFVSRRGGGLLMLGGPDSFVRRQVRPDAGRRDAARSTSTRRPSPPGRAETDYRLGPHPRRLAPALGPDPQDRGRGASG